jgi:hypothetical protein
MNPRLALLMLSGFAWLSVCQADDQLKFSDVRVGQSEDIVLPALGTSADLKKISLFPDTEVAMRETLGDVKSYRVLDRQSGKVLGEITFIRGKVMAIKRQTASLQGPQSDFAKELYSAARVHTQPIPSPNKIGNDMTTADMIALLAQIEGQRTGTTKITLTDPPGVGDDLKLCLDWTTTSRVCISFSHSKDYGDLATLEEIESWDLANVPLPARAQ